MRPILMWSRLCLRERDERVLDSREICMRYYSGDVKFASFRASANIAGEK